MIGEFEKEKGICNGTDDRVRREGTLNETRDSDSGLSILEERRLGRNDKLAESVRLSKEKRRWIGV